MTIDLNAPTLDHLHLSDVARFDIWDRRECAVANPLDWHQACKTYRSTPRFAAGIPHTIHQIWIGSRQPPCVWLDTWRIDYMTRFRSPPTASDAPWDYLLWDNAAVRDLPMLNRALFDAETAPQCQADILRLEVLYEYGGVYIDADIVSTSRDLRPALAAARHTGFMITYEPDTKDKPYSILGNSIIACTPRHPLILMLMSYVKQVYPVKRPHYGVEWVTGPLTYTKVLVDTDMPMYIPPRKHFYPAFHYVPNPSAIDLSTVDAYCFQFGYTCSGLSQWVADNNTCRKPLDCPHHANIDYPLGALIPLPPNEDAPNHADIPSVIHQFSFHTDLDARPVRWIDSWRNVFCPAAGFTHELWTWDRLRDEIAAFFCANLYLDQTRLDDNAVAMLALEVLHARGGYYVPLSTTYTGSSEDASCAAHSIFGTPRRARLETASVFGYPVHGAGKRIHAAYDKGSFAASASTDAALPAQFVADMRFGDGVAARTVFKPGSRFLGASEIYWLPDANADAEGDNAKNPDHAAPAALVWAYDCQVPIFRMRDERDLLDALKSSGKRAVVVTDPLFDAFPALVNDLPGVMYRYERDAVDWDFIAVCVEWEVDQDGLCDYVASCATRPPTARYLGFIINDGAAASLPAANIDAVLARHDTGRVRVASEKSRHSGALASMFRVMPAIEHACRALSDFVPSFERDAEEVHGRLFKAFRDGQIAFEVQTDEENRVMFRSWGENGSVNCECKVAPGMSGMMVEMLRLFDGSNVLFETTAVSAYNASQRL